MTEVFLSIINMSISASWVLLAVLVLRLLLKKAPKWIAVVLWGVVAVRLICPISLESIFSLIPSAETVSPGIMTDQIPTINTGIPIINNTINPIISGSFTPAPGVSANPLQLWIPTFAAIWVTGMVGLLAYTVISYLRVKRKIGTAVLLHSNIYQSENVISPFVLGVIKPKIYLPFRMNQQDMGHVIAHENAHICRKDHLWKPVGFLLLTLHWFNPLMWLGYILLCRDIELACDEKVIKELDHDARADYSQALLTCSVNRRMIAACPLAFGEVGVKERVKSVLNYKKPAFWIIIGAIVICIVVAVCFLTNPPQKDDDPPTGEVFTEYEGVYVFVDTIEENAEGDTVFNLVWRNDTGYTVNYRWNYFVEYKEGEEWVSAWAFIIDSAYFKPPLYSQCSAKESYRVDKNFIAEPGIYRLRLSFSVEDGKSDQNYDTWIEFNTDALTESVTSKQPEIHATLKYDAYSSLHHLKIKVENSQFYVLDCLLPSDVGYVLYDSCSLPDNFKIDFEPRPFVNIPDEHLEKLKNSEVLYFLATESDKTLIKQLAIYDIGDTYYIYTATNEGFSFAPYAASHTDESYLPTPDILRLEEKYPQFFGLDTSNGLTVYRGIDKDRFLFNWYLTTGGTDDRTFLEIGGASLREMQAIVDSYGLDKEKIRIECETNAISSVSGNEALRKYFENIFWLRDNIIRDYRVTDIAVFDVDNDGAEELCILQDAMFSGLAGVVFSVQSVDNYTLEYSTTFLRGTNIAFFQKGTNGIVRVKMGTRLYDITMEDGTMEDGKIQLFRGGYR